ncbi:MAG: TetR/AcrR family transcriptional regulator [Treponema sp.]|nr:TetR/AcrR family transcriptional regulator [Treponema sp.]
MSYDYDKTHENILKSAKEQFKTKGFRDASIRKICNDAGVTNGAFYAHFESKEDLFKALVEPCLNDFFNLYSTQAQDFLKITSREDIISAFEKTYSATKNLIDFIYENKEVMLLILTSSDGTYYANFKELLIKAESDSMLEFLNKGKDFMQRPENITEFSVKSGSSFIINAILESFIQGDPEEEVLRKCNLISEYCIAGYRKILGI